MALNRYPVWKNVLVLAIVLLGLVYAAPNLFGENPAVQVSSAIPGVIVGDALVEKIQNTLQDNGYIPLNIEHDNQSILIRFISTDVQLKVKEILQEKLGQNYLVALNLASASPLWLRAIGAVPMKLGLDLRGGIHLLLQVDVDSVLKQRIEGDLSNIGMALRSEHIRYTGLIREGASNVRIQFRDQAALSAGTDLLSQKFPEFSWTRSKNADLLSIEGVLAPQALQQIRQDTLEQAMNTLRNRVNELGVSEAVVQQQGTSRVAVDLPGIQDAVQAKNILGKTATLEFKMVDNEHDSNEAKTGFVPADSKLYDYSGHGQILLKNKIILRGSSITSARSGMGEDGRASVDVRLGGGNEGMFVKTTAENVGKPMAVVYVEIRSLPKIINGKRIIEYKTENRIISVATILQPLGNNFQITGLASQEEARTLALLLRAGALPAPVTIIEERQVGPSLGKQNIKMGVLSVAVGFALVVIFLAIYYRVMGLIADLALGVNLVLIVAILSLLGATLTLPGIAGIVLTVGMAADANVLIFERIREELRNGASVQASIHAGYERAFVTIVDANLTTLIVAIVLFGLGSGVVKAFAVTVTIGLITSMFTAITGTRVIVNLLYGARSGVKISIGGGEPEYAVAKGRS